MSTPIVEVGLVPLRVELVSADRLVWAGDASMVVARTVDGEMGVLPGHAPVLGVLGDGEVRISALDGGPVVASVDGGFLSVEHDRVTLVSDQATLVAGSATA
jgi:F-type H+-transporting ATPase subunit epsilon